jgi:hypothetical protein
MKTYGGNEVQFHTFCTSTTVEDVNNVVSCTLSSYTIVCSLRKASCASKHVACILISNKQVCEGYLYTQHSRSRWPRGLQPLVCWDCGFESRRVHGCLSLVSVVCCQVEVSATGRSLVQRSPTDCGVSEWNVETSTRRRPWP